MTDAISNDVGASPIHYDIRKLSNLEEDTQKVWQMWHTIFSDWPIEKERFSTLIFSLPGHHHWIHENGFCLSFYSKTEPLGRIAALGVLPEHRRKGLGNALLEKGKAGLRDAAREDGGKALVSLEIGSVFPRFWWQVPNTVSAEVKEFFSHRTRDLYKDIRETIVPPEITERVSKTKATFSPWSAELYEECMVKQEAQFSWSGIYKAIAARDQHGEVMVAFDPDTNEQIGWTMMCSYSSIAHVFAFLHLPPSGKKTGLIAAVGVDEKARGKGIGLALVVKAMENLHERGMEGILVDAVSINGFYERLGFGTLWEYEGYGWR
ncbi:hypothetical protein FGRMN_6904 [Fusarium graminum]|nr:hypothetical protein FGRMN_6904 [Fusarium graminum]